MPTVSGIEPRAKTRGARQAHWGGLASWGAFPDYLANLFRIAMLVEKTLRRTRFALGNSLEYQGRLNPTSPTTTSRCPNRWLPVTETLTYLTGKHDARRGGKFEGQMGKSTGTVG